MIIHRGIYFHSPDDYRYISSKDILFTYLNIGMQLGQLMKPQGNNLKEGLKYYFSFPVTHGNQNYVVFGIGETVSTLQIERSNVKVPYIQYFLTTLSDFVDSGIMIDPVSWLKNHCSSYTDVFTEYCMNNKVVKCEPLQDVTNYRDNKMRLVHLTRYEKDKSVRVCAVSFEEACERQLQRIQDYPRIIRWAYSVLVTPLDDMYSFNVITVYPKTDAGIEKIEKSHAIEPTAMSDEEIYSDFSRFINDKLSLDMKSFLDKTKLEDIYANYNEFVQNAQQKFVLEKNPQGASLQETGQAVVSETVPIAEAVITPQKVNILSMKEPEIKEPRTTERKNLTEKLTNQAEQLTDTARKIFDLKKEPLSIPDATSKILNSANEAQANVTNAQNLENAMLSIQNAINAIYLTVEDSKENINCDRLGEPLGKAFLSLADCCNRISNAIDKKRPGYYGADEKSLIEFMDHAPQELWGIQDKYKGKTKQPFDRLTSGFLKIFDSLRDSKTDEIQVRFKKYRSKYFPMGYF